MNTILSLLLACVVFLCTLALLAQVMLYVPPVAVAAGCTCWLLATGTLRLWRRPEPQWHSEAEAPPPPVPASKPRRYSWGAVNAAVGLAWIGVIGNLLT